VFKKKTSLVGLDIGSRSIKAAEIIETKRGNRLDNFGIVDIAPGLIEENTIRDPEGVADAIRNLMRSHGIREQNVAVSIGGYSAIVKPISVDLMSEEQLEESIRDVAEQYVPYDTSDIDLGSDIVGESKTDPNKMDVILVAAKRPLVPDYVDLVRMAGLNPMIVDHELLALQNIFEMNYERPEGSVALIDIGASKTSLNILKEDAPVITREVPQGCGQIDQKIISDLGCTYEEAEAIKKGDSSDSISTADLRGIIRSVVIEWCSEMRRALDFFYQTYAEDSIDTIYLSGGGAHMKEFHQRLSQEAGADVETLDPCGNLAVNSERVDGDYLRSHAPQAAICLGLALRRADDR